MSADLMANVASGLRRNTMVVGPAIANQRLVDSAKGLAEDLLTDISAKSDAAMQARKSVRTWGDNTYAPSSHGQQRANHSAGTARALVQDVLSTLGSLQVSSSDDVEKSIEVLEGLEKRARSLAQVLQSRTDLSPLDQTV